MDIKLVRETVAKIKSQLFRNSNAFAIGMLRSHFKGTGLQFKEHQVYAHGDDVRFIDWKMLAKTSIPYVKNFEEERNVEIAVVIDASPSMTYGHGGISKLQAAIEICCLLFLLAKESGDYIHCLILADEIIDLPRRNGELGIINLISVLEDKKILLENGRVNIAYRSKDLDQKVKTKAFMKHFYKNREIVFLSDFLDSLSLDVVNRILAHKNVHCFQILSPLDVMEKLPFQLLSERGKYVRVSTDKKEIKKKEKLKQLFVNERYLEDFVNEML
jgi:uncharacterized protein (DUF58 family)